MSLPAASLVPCQSSVRCFFRDASSPSWSAICSTSASSGKILRLRSARGASPLACVRSVLGWRSLRFAPGAPSLLPSPFERGMFPPRRTASGEAYSMTSFLPSRKWFFGLTSASVAYSAFAKSTNAHLSAKCSADQRSTVDTRAGRQACLSAVDGAQLAARGRGSAQARAQAEADHAIDVLRTLCTSRCPRTCPCAPCGSTASALRLSPRPQSPPHLSLHLIAAWRGVWPGASRRAGGRTGRSSRSRGCPGRASAPRGAFARAGSSVRFWCARRGRASRLHRGLCLRRGLGVH